MDNVSIDLEQSPCYVTVDKGNRTAYVLSGTSSRSFITPITYSRAAGFRAGSTVGLNGTINAIAADPASHLVFAGTYFGGVIEDKYFGVQVYDPSRNFEQCGFLPLPIPNAYDYSGLSVVQMGIHDNRLFVGADNQDPQPGASGVVYVIDDFSRAPSISTIEDIEPTGEGMKNFSFYKNRLYFTNYNSRNLICIDIDKKAVASVTDVSDGTPLGSSYRFPIATAISPSKHEIYVAQFNGGKGSTIKTLDILSEVPTPLGHILLRATDLARIAIDDANKIMWGGSGGRDGFVTFVDVSTDREMHQMSMDGAIYSVAMDSDSHLAFIANATQKKVFCYAEKFFTA